MYDPNLLVNFPFFRYKLDLRFQPYTESIVVIIIIFCLLKQKGYIIIVVIIIILVIFVSIHYYYIHFRFTYLL